MSRRETLHVFVLATLASQPLYELLARSPEFFLVRRADLLDVLLAPLLCSLVVPAVLVAVATAAGAIAPAARRLAFTAVVAGLAALIALPVFVRFVRPAGVVPLAGGVIVGGVFALAYRRVAAVRMFVSALAPALVVLPGVYLLRTRSLVAPDALVRGHLAPPAPPATPAPVVMIVFDEFGLEPLLDARGEIDAALYPSFARLAREGTWFRNATTVSSVTQGAVPALLTGRLPPANALADPGVRARNLFTLLAGSHRLDVTETYVPFCPAHLCGDRHADERDRASLAADLLVVALRTVLPVDLWGALPEIAHGSMLVQPVPDAARLGALVALLGAQHAHDAEDSGRRARVLAGFVARVGTAREPALHYLHVMMPHEPSVYLPSGAICANARRREPGRWPEATWRVADAYQRHVLQVQFVDRVIGRLLARLDETGTWDATLLVVTADHGVSFRPGHLRRALSAENHCDVLRVPLFVKAPGQRAGGPSDRNVESIDVLPTVAALLGVEVPWATDGASALAPERAARPDKIVAGPSWPEEETWFAGAGRRTLAAAAFAARCAVPPPARGWLGTDARGATSPFAVGPHRALVDRPANELAAGPAHDLRAILHRAERYADVDPGSGRLPCPIEGRIEGAGARHVDVLAIAVGGTVRAVTKVEPEPGGGASFSVVVPEAAFRAGRNDVVVFRVAGPEGAARLEPIHFAVSSGGDP